MEFIVCSYLPAMPSFDIVSEVDLQKLDNAVNVALKEIGTRYDFQGSRTEVELDKKALIIKILTENDMRMKAIQDILISRIMKQGLDPNCLDFGKEMQASGNMIRKEVKVRQGVDKESARDLIKLIKESGIKVQASVMDDQIRVTGKKIDDLQAVISRVKAGKQEIPLQFTNFRN